MSTGTDPALDVLARTWREEIPITDAMALAPVARTPGSLEVRADLAPNVNVHGTAFAGSLYAVAALSGWGLVHLELEAAGLDGSIVIAEGRIRYVSPVADALHARCETSAEEIERVCSELRTRGRARWPLTAVIRGAEDDAVRFDGVYAIKLRS